MILITFLGILLALLVIDSAIKQSNHELHIDNSVLHDQVLAYHLDWNRIQDRKFLTYLTVKKINAIVRYQALANVSYEQAQDAIEYLLAHPELLPETQQKRRPPLPYAEDEQIRYLIQRGDIARAVSHYAILFEVDQFTAQQVITNMQYRDYLSSVLDVDVIHFSQNENDTRAIK